MSFEQTLSSMLESATAYVSKAREKYADPSSDDIEIDDDPFISTADGGIWVNAWVWVSDEEIEVEDPK